MKLARGFLFVFFFSFFALFPLFGRDLSANEKKALNYIRELFFEVTRYNATGLSSLSQSQGLAEISKTASSLMLCHKSEPAPLHTFYLCEYYNPEKTGIIDSTFCPEDLLSTFEDESEEYEKLDWIDYLLQGLDSYVTAGESDSFDVRDGSKILEMLEGGDGRGIDGLEDSKLDEELPQEFTYIKNDGNIRRFSYDGEQFTSWKENENTILVNYYGEKLIRKKFDSLYRLIKSENFTISSSAKNSVLEKSTEYDYREDSTMPFRSVEDDFSSKRRICNEYDEMGRSVMLLESHYEEREIKSKEKSKEQASEKTDKPKTETLLLDDKKTSRVYDEKGRAVQQEIITWTYKKTFSGRFSRNQRSVKTVFDYSSVTDENNFPPDLKFYENGELHLERKYSGPNSYSEKLYFEDGFSVEVLYENSVKTTEIIYINGKEQRRREFDH